MDKICVGCNIQKPFGEFYIGKNTCKECMVKANRDYRKNKRVDSAKEQEEPDIKPMMEQVQKIQTALIDKLPRRDKYLKINDLIRELQRLNDVAADDIRLDLKLNLPEDLHKYLIQLQSSRHYYTNYATLRHALMYLTDKDYEHGFEEQFGMKRECLIKYSELLDDMYHMVGFVKGVYLVLMDDHLARVNSKFIPIAEHIPEREFKNSVYIRFDNDGGSIVAVGNPLKLDNSTFLKEADRLINSNNPIVMPHVVLGYYDKFQKMLIS